MLKKKVGLGRIANLEEHVRPDWWKKLFNANYLKTDGDLVEDHEITAQEVDLFIKALQLEPEHRILDLCCGQGRHSLAIAERGFRKIFGLDQSKFLIELAKKRAQQAKIAIDYTKGDARKLPYPDQFFDRLMLLGNSFGYFASSKEDVKSLAEAFRVLKKGGRLLIDLTDGDFTRENFEKQSWEWIDKKMFVCRERTLSKDQNQLISREIITQIERGVVKDQFYAERLYSKKEIQGLLASCQFQGFCFHPFLEVKSKRDVDYGMMRRRMILTAEKPLA